MVLTVTSQTERCGDTRNDAALASFQDAKLPSDAHSPSSSSRASSFGSSSYGKSTDSSDSDCTCEIESSPHFEDSEPFNCVGEPGGIIAPPSPFVTRQEARRQMRARSVGESAPKTLYKQMLDKAQLDKAQLDKAQLDRAQLDRAQLDKTQLDKVQREQQDLKQLHSMTIYVNGASNQNHQLLKDPPNRKTREDEQIKPEETPVTNCPEMTSKILFHEKSVRRGTSQEKKLPVIYLAVSPPLCKACQKKQVPYFDTGCASCWAAFKTEGVTPSHVFSVLRIWIPQIQRVAGRLIKVALELGCGVEDRDAVTDMTLLHFAVKSGSLGMGDPTTALQIVTELLEMDADLRQRCKWTSMTALHYAAFFDVPSVLDVILRCPDGVPIDDPCPEYHNGTALHIAASNLSEGAVRVLLHHGASSNIKDSQGRTPLECIPSCEQYELVPDLQELLSRLEDLLRIDVSSHPRLNPVGAESCSSKGVWGKAILAAIGLKIGDRVLISGVKTGLLRYAGPTEFATGLWAGVELEMPQGRHNGTVKGVVYFRCSKNYGIFVPLNRLTKIPNVIGPRLNSDQDRQRSRMPERRSREDSAIRGRRSSSLPSGKVNHGKVDVSKIGSRVAEDIRNSERKLNPGDRVFVDLGLEAARNSLAKGIVRFTGPVNFAAGYWIGVELHEPRGSHDGSVCGTRYFTCGRNHGIFSAPSRVSKVTQEDLKSSSSCLSNKSGKRSSSENQRQQPTLYSTKTTSSLTDSCSTSSSSLSSPFLLGEEQFVPLALPGIGHSMQSLKTSFYPTHTSMTNLNKCFSGRYISSRQKQEELDRSKEEKENEPTWLEIKSIQHIPGNKKPKTDNPNWLQVGHSVFYKNNVGMVKYVGSVHFAEGVWLGLAMRDRKGRHNGVVKGKRYFSCKAGHGVMVTPNMVTVHGLNGDLLVKQEDGHIGNYYHSFSVI